MLELLNRLDEIVVFDPLSHDELKKVARLQMKDVAIRLVERGVALGFTDTALDLVVHEAYDPISNHFVSCFIQSNLPGDVPPSLINLTLHLFHESSLSLLQGT